MLAPVCVEDVDGAGHPRLLFLHNVSKADVLAVAGRVGAHPPLQRVLRDFEWLEAEGFWRLDACALPHRQVLKVVEFGLLEGRFDRRFQLHRAVEAQAHFASRAHGGLRTRIPRLHVEDFGARMEFCLTFLTTH